MFNSFFMEATRVTGSLLLPMQRPILRSVIALPGIVAGGGAALEKAPPKHDGEMVFQRMHNDATSNENKILHLEVR